MALVFCVAVKVKSRWWSGDQIGAPLDLVGFVGDGVPGRLGQGATLATSMGADLWRGDKLWGDAAVDAGGRFVVKDAGGIPGGIGSLAVR